MTYAGSDEGKFVYGNIYGSYQYETDPDSSDTCNELQTVVKKEALQLAFKFYAEMGQLFIFTKGYICNVGVGMRTLKKHGHLKHP